MYLYLINALSALFFVVTGIQFWVTNYLTAPVAETGLGFDFKTVVIGFALKFNPLLVVVGAAVATGLLAGLPQLTPRRLPLRLPYPWRTLVPMHLPCRPQRRRPARIGARQRRRAPDARRSR